MDSIDYGVERLSEVDLVKEVQMVTSVWAKSAEQGQHPSITIPFEVLHLLRGFWINKSKENVDE